jgi:hypothetical protein
MQSMNWITSCPSDIGAHVDHPFAIPIFGGDSSVQNRPFEDDFNCFINPDLLLYDVNDPISTVSGFPLDSPWIPPGFPLDSPSGQLVTANSTSFDLPADGSPAAATVSGSRSLDSQPQHNPQSMYQTPSGSKFTCHECHKCLDKQHELK